jgi:hypothetical protein
VNHRLRRRHRWLIALVAAGVLLGVLMASTRPLPLNRGGRLPAPLEAQP